jgi:hypothetical protein
VKEEQDNEEAAKAAQMSEYERRHRLIASSNDPEDCLGLQAVYMASFNDKDAWRGDVDAAIAVSIRDAGMPLSSSAVKDERLSTSPTSAASKTSSTTTCTTSTSTTTPLGAASTTILGFGFKFDRI